ELAEDERQLAIVAGLERELDPPIADLLRSLDAGVVGAILRRALRTQCVERPDDVVRRDRLSVVPARLWPQGEADPRAIGGALDRLRQPGGFARRRGRG